MPENEKVSIITPCLNSEKTIRDTIESVLGQTYKDIEYIIVDGKSADGTMAIVEKYRSAFGDRLVSVSEKDGGIYEAMNKGILRASGDVIGIINSDDWYEPRAVERAMQYFRDTEAEVVYGESWIIDDKGQREYHTIHSQFPPHPSTFVKREVYQKYGMFDLRYRIAADRDLLLRFMEKGVRFVHTDEILANFRKTGISNQNRMACAKESYEIEQKYLGKCPEGILNRGDVDEKYAREKLVYISRVLSEAMGDMLCARYHWTNGLVIFGAGVCGKEWKEIMERCHIPVLFFVDNDERKWGLEVNGKKIFSPEILRYGRVHVVITTTRFQEDIGDQLQHYQNPELTWSILADIRQYVITQWEHRLL